MGYIDRNPFAGFEKPAAGRRETVVTDAEYERLPGLCKDGEFREPLVVAWETGARPQELTGVDSAA